MGSIVVEIGIDASIGEQEQVRYATTELIYSNKNTDNGLMQVACYLSGLDVGIWIDRSCYLL